LGRWLRSPPLSLHGPFPFQSPPPAGYTADVFSGLSFFFFFFSHGFFSREHSFFGSTPFLTHFLPFSSYARFFSGHKMFASPFFKMTFFFAAVRGFSCLESAPEFQSGMRWVPSFSPMEMCGPFFFHRSRVLCFSSPPSPP